jgi:ATP-binding cassette, subfamily B, bacterial
VTREWPRFIGALTAMLAATVFAFAVPLVVQVVIDSALLGEPLPPFPLVRAGVALIGGIDRLRARLEVAAVIIVVLTGGNGLFSFLAGRISATGAERNACRTRNQLYQHIQAVSMAWHGSASTGDLMQRCTSDVDTVRKFYAIQLMEIGRALAMVFLAIPLMIRLHSGLTFVAILCFPAAILYTRRFFLNVQKTFLVSDETEGELAAILQEHLSGLRVVRSLAREPEEVARFGAINDRYRDVTMHLLHELARYWGVSTLIVTVQTGAVVAAAIIPGVFSRPVTVGTLMAFLMLEQMLLWPIRQMGMVLADLGKARVARERIEEILRVPVEDKDPVMRGPGTLRPPIRGKVEFRNVSFSYAGAPVLENVSFLAEPGQTVGILGPTGSGKTTMMMLLARLYDPRSGTILVDGQDIIHIERRWMRRNLGYVLQEPFLFARTIGENISLARSSAEEAEIIAAARAAAVHDVISGFRGGYDTTVGERGVTLSGGQKQRVTIARALLMDSPVLVFDDSLSAVDNRTDARIREALLARTATTFLISHRISTLARADLLLVMKSGRIVEQGSPTVLLEQDGPFAQAWSLQQEDYHAG